MVEPLHETNGRPVHPDIQFEHSDASFRWIAIIVAGAAIAGIAIHLIVIRFFFDYDAHENAVKKSPYPLASVPANGPPAAPQLEQVERIEGPNAADVYEREKYNLTYLESYGPTEEPSYVHVPIDRAMQVLLRKGTLKSSQEPPLAQRRRADGLLDSGAPNSGRFFNLRAK